jgi:hypothetical protein
MIGYAGFVSMKLNKGTLFVLSCMNAADKIKEGIVS